MMKPTFVAAAAALLVGCASGHVGRDFNAANLPQLQVGRTTVEEASSLLGSDPIDSARTVHGNWAYEWRFVEATTVGFSTTTGKKDIVLIFSADGPLIGIASMSGISLSAADRKRLFAVPRAGSAAK